ncbi:tRNA threonylcarbamoyladenosine biosynthesis protein TsaB [Caprobacter fermentans]|uniref:tRNA threonylcarbamoyladenosine biosynthesis protein TsaB n=1 Tax=Caproicibacter fermentans TaxID=2576756 RepID=A0A6N8I153_9FIRM|nr:tRNA (adenosine(37)-N6)-threonylcarbamoyltransferase complex dimerization subunit type 1 TsaB [Caproicibacter fermentans]MVB11844.1 tRNA threonylcarbamoyladenosine biosynthesis protein TsaB [Caproicibacter fermentans]OCN00646.1 tRNA N6-adenosine(37)-N6-threonylcarbamoyltransferase complex dimerization subunit TsaB [Clostridium sp. W14A]
MKILAIDSSAITASAAVTDDGKILGEYFLNTGLTHSETLMPMIESVLQCAKINPSELDLFAVSSGPGSFTGIRIGIASIKGLAMPFGTSCAGVSTLEAIAQNLSHLDCVVCAVMDARCGQVYNALFRAEKGSLKRLTPDRAIAAKELAAECEKLSEPIYLAGDGAKLCAKSESFQRLGAILPPEPLIYQRAWGVAKAAEAAVRENRTVSPAELMPFYLRPAQAERSLKKQLGGKEI